MRIIILLATTLIPLSPLIGLFEIEYAYFGGYGGLSFVEDKIKDVDLDYELGFLGGITDGIKWCGGLRSELEVSYRYNHIDDIKINGDSTQISGFFSVWGFLLNILYDIPFDWNWTPYLGLGVGAELEKARLFGQNLMPVNRSDVRFTGQLIGGLSYSLGQRCLFFTDYKYFLFDDDTQSHAVTFGIRFIYSPT